MSRNRAPHQTSELTSTLDVILSPFKPQLKNVTAEDVASSLYYIHLELPSADLGAPPSAWADDARSSSEGSSSAMAIPRKPVPDAPRSQTPDTPSSSPRNNTLPTPHSSTDKLATRNRGSSLNSQDDWRPVMPSSLANKSSPAAPTHRPIDEQSPCAKAPALQAPPVRKPVGPRAMVPAARPPAAGPSPPTAAVRQRSQSDIRDVRGARQPFPRPPSRSPSPRKRGVASAAQGEPFALTLIRRDPGTGSQWNVGRVTSRQLDDQFGEEEQQGHSFGMHSPPETTTLGKPPINIRIETSGYAKFRRMPKRRSMEAASLEALAASMANGEDDQSLAPDQSSVFSRQVQMGYSKSLMSNLRDKFHRFEDQVKNGHARQGSDSSLENAKETNTSLGQPGPGMKPRGYAFTSPWDGKCDFRTGNGGRSVRCYHTLYDGQSAAYNPLVADQGSSMPKTSAVAVSELRFNLPSGELFNTSEQDGMESKLRGHFAKLLRPNGGPIDDEDDSVSPFDVNVGSEKAGGGNRGTRAKLGKLIVYDDGLKMLDLLVAANMGVWWGAWERSF